jgi:hypothetical protein
MEGGGARRCSEIGIESFLYHHFFFASLKYGPGEEGAKSNYRGLIV